MSWRRNIAGGINTIAGCSVPPMQSTHLQPQTESVSLVQSNHLQPQTEEVSVLSRMYGDAVQCALNPTDIWRNADIGYLGDGELNEELRHYRVVKDAMNAKGDQVSFHTTCPELERAVYVKCRGVSVNPGGYPNNDACNLYNTDILPESFLCKDGIWIGITGIGQKSLVPIPEQKRVEIPHNKKCIDSFSPLTAEAQLDHFAFRVDYYIRQIVLENPPLNLNEYTNFIEHIFSNPEYLSFNKEGKDYEYLIPPGAKTKVCRELLAKRKFTLEKAQKLVAKIAKSMEKEKQEKIEQENFRILENILQEEGLDYLIVERDGKIVKMDGRRVWVSCDKIVDDLGNILEGTMDDDLDYCLNSSSTVAK